MRSHCKLLVAALAVAGVVTSAPAAHAGAVVLGAYNSNSFPANDDLSTGLTSLGMTLNFFGVNYSSAYLNNNGNITFTQPLGTFTPFQITGGSLPMLAPFFADVDTRGASALMTYGAGTFGGRNAFGVNWVNVGYFSGSPGPNRNSFQLILVDRSDVAAGDFDFMFNYDQIQWETGQASGSDAQGCLGTSARAGWTNGQGTSLQLAGSGVNGAFIDSGTCVDGSPYAGPGNNALIRSSLNSDQSGRYLFNVRNGVVQVPEPASLLLLGAGLVGVSRRFTKRGSRA